MSIANGIQSQSSYFNEAGEPLMSAEAARYEAALDEQSWEERYSDPDYQDQEQERYDSFMEEVYEQQQEGQCPACGEEGCEAVLVADHDRYTDQVYVVHKS